MRVYVNSNNADEKEKRNGTLGKSIVSKGKNVKEAVSTALQLLNGASLSEVDIDILEPESKGILGFGAKPAIVRVTLRQMEDTHLREDMILPRQKPIERSEAKTDLSGKVWVKNGQIFCTDGPDRYPLVSIGPGLILRKNNEVVVNTALVRRSDMLEVELRDEEHAPSWELQVSEDKMKAVVKIKPGVRIFRRLKDVPPSDSVQLEVEEKIIPMIIETGPILEKLKELGVVYGIDYTELARASSSEEAGAFTIAKGTPPNYGTNGYLEPVQEIEIKKALKERSDGTINYRETQQFPSVDYGQVIGIVHPPVPGSPGRTVTNEPVFPPEVVPLVVQKGKGVLISDDGTKVIAAEKGHPDIQIKGTFAKISVVPKLLIGTDVNLEVGNVHYVGDVEVLGAVQDGMFIEAQGNILVKGNANMAKLQSGRSIIVHKNVISSHMYAGKNSALIDELNEMASGIYEQLEHLINTVQQLVNASTYKDASGVGNGLAPVFKILLDGKFKTLASMILSFWKKLKEGKDELDESWFAVGNMLHKNFVMTDFSGLKSIYDVSALWNEVGLLCKFSAIEDGNSDCFITANYVQNSLFYSSGDIHITGEGLYNSKLVAKGSIRIDGYVRGGEIYGEKGVIIEEAGTKGGVPTKIQVPKDQTIIINRVLEDTVIQIGGKTHTFLRETSAVRARLNEDRFLVTQ